MFELLKAAAWRYIKICIAETIYDIQKEINKRKQEDQVEKSSEPRMEGSGNASTDFEHPYLLGRENEITAGFGFTSANRESYKRTRD